MACFRSTLSDAPKIKTVQDLDAVLAELSVLAHYQNELTSECSREIDKVKAAYQAQLVCSVGRSTVDLATRRKQLVDVAEAWCRKHLGKHLPADQKSLQLSHGVAGFRAQTPKVALAEGVTEKIAIERIEAQTGIVAAVTALLTKVWGLFTVGQVVRLVPELNKVEIKKLWDGKPDARATLAELGITVQAGEDLVVLEPTRHSVAKPAS